MPDTVQNRNHADNSSQNAESLQAQSHLSEFERRIAAAERVLSSVSHDQQTKISTYLSRGKEK